MPEPEPPPDEPLVLDYSRLWSLPPTRAYLSLSVVVLVLTVVVLIILALAAPLIRLVRDTASALFA
jgi:hypothetical protein